MVEQELASIFSFVLKASDNPMPYYRNLPQDFCVPSAYFPVPEIITYGDTFSSYGAEYEWFVKFFHSTTQEAYSIALKALTAIKESRNLIPILDENGVLTDEGIRIKDPEIRVVEECAVQLTIRFISRRPYIKPTTPIKPNTQNIVFKIELKPDPRIRERVTYETTEIRSIPVGVEESKTDSSYDYEPCGTKPDE